MSQPPSQTDAAAAAVRPFLDDRNSQLINFPVNSPDNPFSAPINFSITPPAQNQNILDTSINLSRPLPNQNQNILNGYNPFNNINQQAAARTAQQSLPGNRNQRPFAPIQEPPPTPTSFIGQIPFFLDAVLSTPVGALPKKPLWIVIFNFDQNIKNTIKRVKTYEPQMPEPWQIDRALDTVTTRRYQDEKGCMFAQTVTVPGDALNYSQEGITYNSYIRGGVATGRKDFDTLRIGFLNTNVSFVDNVIRPWVVMTGHLGMIARPPQEKYRCDITIYKLGITTVDKPPYILQQYNFWDACPINVIAEQLDYTDGVPVIKEAEFAYQWYTTSSLRSSNTGTSNTGTAEGTIARAVNPNAPVEVRRALPVTAPGPYDNI